MASVRLYSTTSRGLLRPSISSAFFERSYLCPRTHFFTPQPNSSARHLSATGRKLNGTPQYARRKTNWAPKVGLAVGIAFVGALGYIMVRSIPSLLLPPYQEHVAPFNLPDPSETPGEAFADTTVPEQAEKLEPQKMESPTIAEKDTMLKRNTVVGPQSPMRLRMEAFIKHHQQEIVASLEKVDGKRFQQDSWNRPDGGGGLSCVLQDGNVFEKAGVNTSVVYGKLTRAAIAKMRANHPALDPDVESLEFFAAGLSMVLHPSNPMAPTVHLNYRYFETIDPRDGGTSAWWFGGGCDLTPCYLFDEDAIHFHKTIKEACEKHDKSYYPRFKKWCDEYFCNKHRGETRGVGGIFFDDLDDNEKDQEQLFSFVQSCMQSFLPSYIPIIEKRKTMPFTEQEKIWQQLRRGRYVEFNLIHDRGTAFGLNTPGSRVESILMSLPLTARWQYMHEPEKGSREARLVDVLKKPQEWV